MEAAQFLMDDVYARRCDLEGSNGIFAADLLYHRNCFPGYIFKYNTAKKKNHEIQLKIKRQLKESGWSSKIMLTRLLILELLIFGLLIFELLIGMSFSGIRDMINDDNPEIDMKSNEVKVFLEEEFGNDIQFYLLIRE